MKSNLNDESFRKRTCEMGDELADDTIAAISRLHGLAQVSKILRGLVRNDCVHDLLDDSAGALSAPHFDTQKQCSESERQGAARQIASILRNYLDASGTLPDWTQPDLLKESEAIFAEYGMAAFSILGCASLPEAYATPYAARVLGITQQLQNHIQRRIYETSLFVVNVMSPDGLNPGGKGVTTAQRVRLMHAAIRHLIRERVKDAGTDQKPQELGAALLQMNWPAEFGTPIHQLAMSMAIMSFSYIVLRSLRKLGVDLSPRQERAYLHRWNVVGHIMGVVPDLLLDPPERMDQADEFYATVWCPSVGESREGRLLEKALLEYLEGFLPATPAAIRRIPRILTRELVGPTVARVLDVNLDVSDHVGLQALKAATGLHRYARTVANVIGMNTSWADNAGMHLLKGSTGLEHLNIGSADEFPPLRVAAEWLFRIMAKGLLDTQRGGDREPFEIPTALAKERWRLRS
jgi:ER-bound oxygenase mpaB/B'/Rubber oxygenase, catalytic domain